MSKKTEITHPEMVKKLFKDPSTVSMTPAQINLLHAAVGIAGEAGELQAALLEPIDDTWGSNVMKELGDLEFYCEAMVQHLAIERPKEAHRLPFNNHRAAYNQAARVTTCALAVLDMAKKIAFNNRPETDLPVKTAVEELLAELQAVYRPLGFTRQMAVDNNIQKLGARYEGFEYSDKAAAARKDQKKKGAS